MTNVNSLKIKNKNVTCIYEVFAMCPAEHFICVVAFNCQNNLMHIFSGEKAKT